MNVLNKKMMIFGIVLFLTQNVCAMWDFGKPSLTGGCVDFESYLQKLEKRQRKQALEDQETSNQLNPAIIEAMKNPQEYKEPRKSHGKTLPRTSRKNFKKSNVERK